MRLHHISRETCQDLRVRQTLNSTHQIPTAEEMRAPFPE